MLITAKALTHVGLVVLYISAWASALLVQTDRAMREPLHAGRVTDTDAPLFCYTYVKRFIRKTLRAWVSADTKLKVPQKIETPIFI